MRIGLLTDGIWPFVVGGMQKHSFYLCKYFAKNKIHVELFHTSGNDSEPDLNSIFSPDELVYIRSWYVPKPKPDKYPGHYVRAAYRYSKSIFEKLNLVLKTQPDIQFIYAKGLTGMYLLKHRKNLIKNLPIAINVHGYEYFQKTASLKHKLEQFVLIPSFKYINRKADYIFSYGGKVTELISKNINNTSHKIIEIPTGIESDFLVNEFKPSQNLRKFVFIGRNERRKGVAELNSAISQFSKNVDFQFNFIGEIPADNRIESSRVVYHGVLKDRESITKIMQNADVLVCPSYSEGMPNVILEGMASGCAIIASDVGAVNIQVNEENGWLIVPGSVSSLLNAINEALAISNHDLNLRRKNSIKKVKDNFLWENVIQMKIAAIKSIIKNGIN